jgi:uncharacterized protein YndB with AHSA1/START domain
MTLVQHSIEVDVPVRTAYDQFTQFEEFPRFMGDVVEVRQLDETRLRFVVETTAGRHTLEGRISEQIPDERIVVTGTSGPAVAGIASFEPLGEGRSRVELQLDVAAPGSLDLPSGVEDEVRRRLASDLEAFGRMIEGRGEPTGAWRGAVAGGGVTPDAGTTAEYVSREGAHGEARTRLEAHEASGGLPESRNRPHPPGQGAEETDEEEQA